MIYALAFPNIRPELFSFEIGEFTFALRWYALAYLAGFLIAWLRLASMFGQPKLWAKDMPPMDSSQLDSFATWMIIGVVLGGRVGYAFIYSPGYYLDYPQEILKIWRGGMSFHGGMIGVVVVGLMFCRIYRLSVVRVADAVAVTVPWALFLGRLANFVNGELWGRASEVPWAVVFPNAEGFDCVSACPRHPSQIYEALLEGLVLGLLLTWLAYRRGWLKRPGQITGLFAAGYGAARTFVEIFRLPDQQFSADGNPLGFIIPFSETAGITMGSASIAADARGGHNDYCLGKTKEPMTELLAVLKQRIRSGGPIPVSEYMSSCLLHPQFGFYCRQDPFGRSGSFTTAPEISQMFGEIIGLFLAQVWLDQNSPRKFTLAELGPGPRNSDVGLASLGANRRRIPGSRKCNICRTQP